MTQRSLHAAQILWPAFMVAAILEMVVFASVDPALLQIGAWQPQPHTVYSLSFLTFWVLVAASSSVSQWLMGGQQKATGAAGRPF